MLVRDQNISWFCNGLACMMVAAGVAAAQGPTETVLYSFTGGADGGFPYAGVTLDSGGNLYGTTRAGGTSNAGTVYKVDSSGNETVLYSFTGGDDGSEPEGGVILDPSGNLFGTTGLGGPRGHGVIFKIDTAGTETVLHGFTGRSDGSEPEGTLTFDPFGNLWGTAAVGGDKGAGTVFQLSAAGQFSVFYTFRSGNDRIPYSGVIRDSAGNLYGTAGGEEALGFPGLVYELDPAGDQTVLHAFRKGDKKGGFTPAGGLVFDSAGNLYGTTVDGGTSKDAVGIAFKVDTAGKYSKLYNFHGAGGCRPYAAMIVNSAGNLYGTTTGCGKRYGTVFELTPAGQETVLHTFTGGADGSAPYGSVAFDSSGNLYGTTLYGGTGNGVVFKIGNVAAPRR